ncbi:MAG: biopolymer transporter ExbD [Deltaproteobacteria bacterium]|nr:biopolymer transporter ExbD [Deltaproteobacteria bacterium]
MKADSTGGLRSELNVTPLVDVVLVLLIIFMVVTPLMRNRALELPRASAVEAVKQNPAPVTLTINADKTLLLGSEVLPREHLPAVMGRVIAANPDIAIHVKGDRRLKYKDVKSVLDDLHKAGARRLALAAAEQKEE